MRRAFAQTRLELRQRIRGRDRATLDASVGQIPHPAHDAEFIGDLRREGTEPHALHSTGDQVVFVEVFHL